MDEATGCPALSAKYRNASTSLTPTTSGFAQPLHGGMENTKKQPSPRMMAVTCVPVS
jgi:hypothetical protein